MSRSERQAWIAELWVHALIDEPRPATPPSPRRLEMRDLVQTFPSALDAAGAIVVAVECANCGMQFARALTGRTPTYCSARCRKAASRARHERHPAMGEETA